jgi:hypothetical protein
MKIAQVLFLLAFGAITISCSKKSDDVAPAQQTATSGFQAKIDGKTYAPDFSYALASFPGNTAYYAIYGLDSKTNDLVAIALPSNLAEGTHPISNVSFGIVTYNKEDYSTINSGTGTITIQKKTATNLVGTFSFTAYDATNTKKRALTEGSFNVTVR